MNRYLVKIANKERVEKMFHSKPQLMTVDEINSALEGKGVDAEVVRVGDGREAAIDKVRSLLPGAHRDKAPVFVDKSVEKGPVYVSTHSAFAPSKGLILDGGVSHTTPLIHEAGHAIDYEVGNPEVNALKQRLGSMSNSLASSGLATAAMYAAAAIPNPIGAAAVAAPLLIHAPRIRNEVAANRRAAEFVREAKGREAEMQYRDAMAEPLSSYFVRPLVLAGSLAATHSAAKRIAKMILTKQAMMEKQGDPEVKLKPRSEMTPAELKVLKYKSIAARKRKALQATVKS